MSLLSAVRSFRGSLVYLGNFVLACMENVVDQIYLVTSSRLML